MKIQTLLEGKIKVPTDAYHQLMTAVCTDIFSRIVTYLNSPAGDDYFDNLLKFKQIANQYRKTFGYFDVHEDYTANYRTTHKLYVRMDEVDPRYLKNNPNAKGKIYAILATITASDSDQTPSGGYYKKQRAKAAKIEITVPSQKTIEQVARAPELFETMMHRIEGVVEHELMHGIQDMAFKRIPDELEYYDDKGRLVDDKYYTSELEFSPQLASNAKDFVAYAKDLSGMGYRLDGEGKKALFMNFVNPTAKSPRGIADNTSPFFSTLYNKDKAKWKKAVRYFYGLVQGKF